MKTLHEDNRKSHAIWFLSLLVLFVAVAGSCLGIIYFYQAGLEQQHTAATNEHITEVERAGIERALHTMRSDLQLLAKGGLISAFVRNPSPSERARLQTFFVNLLAVRKNYTQIRLLNAQGMEVVRVNYVQGTPAVVPQDALQNKANRYYVKDIDKLPPGRIYVSRFDLNVEHGAIEQPLDPTLRVGMPIFDGQGNRWGSLIINYSGRELLHDFRRRGLEAVGAMWLVDGKGYWLAGPSPADDWTFMYPDRPQHTLATVYPAVWNVLSNGSSGQVDRSFGLLTYQSIPAESPSYGATGGPRSDSDWQGLDIVSLARNPTEDLARAARRLAPLGLVGLALLTALAAWVSYLVTRLSEARAEAFDNSRLLSHIARHSGLVIAVKDLAGRYVGVNENLAKLAPNPDPYNVLGKTVDEVFAPEVANVVGEQDARVLDADEAITFETPVPQPDGTHILLDTRFPVRSVTGKLQGVCSIATDITEHIRLEEALAVAKAEAESANRAKSAFLANMSHELRTPLNTIIGLSELLMEEFEEQGDLEGMEPLRRVVHAGKHLLALINDILDMSKIEAGKLELHVEAFDVGQLVDSVAETIRPLMELNDNRLTVERTANLGAVESDSTRLRQVLLNLLSNAAKFTHNGEVRLVASRFGDQLVFRVADTGIGMSEEQVGLLFKPFSQGDASISKRFGGTGLGLTICRQLCTMMGGEIAVESEPGKGSIFTVRLPDTVPSVSPGPAPAADSEAALPSGADGARVGTVLVVDDDADAALMIRDILEADGHTVVTADSGAAALRLVRDARPVVMVLDIHLGDMTGWDVLAALRADAELKELPVIVCTITDRSRKGLLFGVVEHLVKPVDRKRLLEVVHRFSRPAGEASVLVVDDDETYRGQVACALEGDGYKVVQARDGKEALKCLHREPPDLILLDMLMPDLDGLGVITEMRKHRAWDDIPVIVVTAADIDGDTARLLSAQAIDVIRKDGTAMQQMLETLRSAVRDAVHARSEPGRGTPDTIE